MNKRLSVVVKNSDLPESDRVKWMEIINANFMSSEESDSVYCELFTKIIRWRAQKLT